MKLLSLSYRQHEPINMKTGPRVHFNPVVHWDWIMWNDCSHVASSPAGWRIVILMGVPTPGLKHKTHFPAWCDQRLGLKQKDERAGDRRSRRSPWLPVCLIKSAGCCGGKVKVRVDAAAVVPTPRCLHHHLPLVNDLFYHWQLTQ